jgi:hypothetical protein
MESWAHRKNIERLEAELRDETDADKRRTLEDVLAAERGRLAELDKTRRSTKGR